MKTRNYMDMSHTVE